MQFRVQFICGSEALRSIKLLVKFFSFFFSFEVTKPFELTVRDDVCTVYSSV